VEAPAPEPRHMRELRDALAEGTPRRALLWRDVFMGRKPRWALQAALFLLGVLVGIVGPRLIGRPGGMPPAPGGREVASVSAVPPEGLPEGLNVAISPDQADQLAREVKADGLKDTVLQGLNKRDLQSARQAFETLRRQYPDSQALRELEKNEELRWLRRQLVVAERS
jgi:hypothetical protein